MTKTTLTPNSTSNSNSTSTRTFTHAELAISPLNIRFNESAIAEVETLSASIIQHGLEQNLLIHAAPDGAEWAILPKIAGQKKSAEKRAKWGVYAGGRRWRAIGLAISRGKLPADFPITAKIGELSDGMFLLDSLGENILRRDLIPVEVHRAIARAADEGLSVKQIADRLGQEQAWVARQLRLGNLHPDIFAAYCEREISEEQAQAYAATEDQALQHTAWLHFRPLSQYNASSTYIRGFMKIGDRELGNLLLFTGEAIYRAKGGRFELDLFADTREQRGRIIDETLLHELAEEKMTAIRGQIRDESDQRDLRFQAEPPRFAGYTDTSLEIFPKAKAGRKYALPKGDVIATIHIDGEGGHFPNFWWASRKAKGAADKTARGNGQSPTESRASSLSAGEAIDAADSTRAMEARQIVRDQHGLTNDGFQIIRSIRRALLRASLILSAEKDSQIPRDYFTWSQLRAELQGDRASFTGARLLQSANHLQADQAPADLVRVQLDDTIANKVWTEAVDAITAADFITEPDPDLALRAFLDAPPSLKRRAEAVLAGLALLRSANTPGWRIAAHDTLAQAIGGSAPSRIRTLWNPSRHFTGMFGKMARLALAQPFVEKSAFKSWHKQKDTPLSCAVSAALNGDQGGSKAKPAKQWVHPLLAFEPAKLPAKLDTPPAKTAKPADAGQSASGQPSEELEAAK